MVPMPKNPVDPAMHNLSYSRPRNGAWSPGPAIPATTEARAALAALCQTYWYPVYTYLRQRYGELLRQQIANTMDGPGEVEEEIRELFSAVAIP